MATEPRNNPAKSLSHERRFSMKLVTAMSAAALVLAPAIGLAQAPANGAGDTKDEPSLKSKVEHVIEKITGSSPDTKVGTGSSPDTKVGTDAKSGARDSTAKSAGNTNYPDFAAVKKTDK
jgi:hypothetical protein